MKDESMVKSREDVPRKRQRRKDILPHFRTGAPFTVRALALWEQTLSATLAEAHPFRFTTSVTGSKADDKGGMRSECVLDAIMMRHSPPHYCQGRIQYSFKADGRLDDKASNADKTCFRTAHSNMQERMRIWKRVQLWSIYMSSFRACWLRMRRLLMP